MSLTADERETTLLSTDGDESVRIWTAQKKYIGRMRRHPAFVEVRSGAHDGTEWAEFEIPAADWNPATGAKRKGAQLTEGQRAALAERLATARQKKKESK